MFHQGLREDWLARLRNGLIDPVPRFAAVIVGRDEALLPALCSAIEASGEMQNGGDRGLGYINLIHIVMRGRNAMRRRLSV